MYAPAITGYPTQTNAWRGYSTPSYQSSTNLYNGGASNSIFGNSSGVVSHVAMSDIMTAPFGAVPMSSGYGASMSLAQPQQTDYMGQMMNMMMQMCMMMFAKKLNNDDNNNSDSAKKTVVVVKGTGNEHKEEKEGKASKVIGGTLSGAASGAALGSIIPGIGTVAGGIVGGALGLIGGLFG